MIINDEWRLESNELNVVLMRKRSKTDNRSKIDAPESYDLFYFGTVAAALQSMIQKEIIGTGMKDLKTINDKIESINLDVKRALGNLRKV
jgi:hypothetical protein